MPGTGLPPRQNGHRGCLPSCPCAPTGPDVAGSGMGRKPFVDPMLLFGLRSAPKIFNAVADTLNWCLQRAGIRFIQHYLDDFIIVASPNSQQAVQTMDPVCARLGVPMAPHKREGPTKCLVFLGIEIDTVAGELRLPEEKLSRLMSLLQEWGSKKSCQRKELDSLIGLLSHACKVVRPGRSFLRRLLDLLHATSLNVAVTVLFASTGPVRQISPGGGNLWANGMGCRSCARP